MHPVHQGEGGVTERPSIPRRGGKGERGCETHSVLASLTCHRSAELCVNQ